MIRLAFVVSMLLATLYAARAQTSPQLVTGRVSSVPRCASMWVREGPVDSVATLPRMDLGARLIVPETARQLR